MTSQSTNELKKFNTIDMKRTWHILNNITEKKIIHQLTLMMAGTEQENTKTMRKKLNIQ